MGLISTEVEVSLCGANIKYYENLGYEIPRKIDKRGRIVCPRGTTLLVNVKDLPHGSNVDVSAKCDCCKKSYYIKYMDYMKYNHDGLTYCLRCSKRDMMRVGRNNCWNFNNDDKNEFEKFVAQYIKLSEEQGYPISSKKLTEKFPSSHWFIKHCPDKNVTSWSKFVAWCGFYSSSSSTKEDVIRLIYKMQENLDRPITYEDFRGSGCYHVPINAIRKHWGTVNNMKQELGLEIVQENMIAKIPSQKEFDAQIKTICDIALNNNNQFCLKELQYYKNLLQYSCLQKYSKKYYNKTLKELLNSYGVSIGNIGQGKVYYFSDGEIATSSHEFIFSSLLRKNGYCFGEDYIRNVKYSTFTKNYNGNMNCDYVFKYNQKLIYIEIAGVLRDYKQHYYSNQPLKGKSKEKYRQTLKQKEKMFIDNQINYRILFPSDLINKTLDEILNDKNIFVDRRDYTSFLLNKNKTLIKNI